MSHATAPTTITFVRVLAVTMTGQSQQTKSGLILMTSLSSFKYDIVGRKALGR